MRRIKLNNKGSAIVSVIVVTTFITILATTMLYSTSMNYLVKQNDYQNKRTFYQAEEMLDNMKAMLAEDVSAACESAYRQTMSEYVYLGSSSARAAYYNEKYVNYLDELWKKRTNDNGYDVENTGVSLRANALIKEYSNYYNETVEDVKKHIMNNKDDEPDISFIGTDVPSDGQFGIKGIIVSYTENGYITYIKTDIMLNAPAYNWGDELDEDMDRTLRMSDYIVYRNWEKY